MKLIMSRIKNSPLLSCLLVFGLVTSILLISIGTSFVSSLFYGEKTIDNNVPPNGEVYSIFGHLKIIVIMKYLTNCFPELIMILDYI